MPCSTNWNKERCYKCLALQNIERSSKDNFCSRRGTVKKRTHSKDQEWSFGGGLRLGNAGSRPTALQSYNTFLKTRPNTLVQHPVCRLLCRWEDGRMLSMKQRRRIGAMQRWHLRQYNVAEGSPHWGVQQGFYCNIHHQVAQTSGNARTSPAPQYNETSQTAE